ncbi:MAG TPA: hypothetical protein VK488_13145 [Gaiellaceae bacterium]|nr:hypothetical protein [Gaiellaceae bacterium]
MNISTEQGLTNEERALIRLAGQFAREFAVLPQLHPADKQEVAFHVHALARVVGMRAAHRAHPDIVPNRSGTPI